MLPIVPESMEALKARVPAALVRVFDARRGMLSPRPGQCRENVFDFEDGVRVIVDLAHFPDQPVPLLHVSVSVEPMGSFLKRFRARTQTTAEALLIALATRVAELVGIPVTSLGQPTLSPGKMVPHWLVTWPLPVPGVETVVDGGHR